MRPSAVEILAVADLDHKDEKRPILDLADQPVVPDAISPQCREGRTAQRLALVTRIGMRRDPLVHEINQMPGCLPIELAQLLEGALGVANRKLPPS